MRSRSKFRNVRTNGYASKREAARAAELHLLEKAGEITNLHEQFPFVLALPNGVDKRPIKYIADFRYHEKHPSGWQLIVEDCKGFRTDVYKLKKRWLYEKFGIRIRET